MTEQKKDEKKIIIDEDWKTEAKKDKEILAAKEETDKKTDSDRRQGQRGDLHLETEQSDEPARDRRSDIGAHHHGYGAIGFQSAGANHRHNRAGRHRRALHQHGGQDAHGQTSEWILQTGEEIQRCILSYDLDGVAEQLNRRQEEVEHQEDERQPRRRLGRTGPAEYAGLFG